MRGEARLKRLEARRPPAFPSLVVLVTERPTEAALAAIRTTRGIPADVPVYIVPDNRRQGA